MCTSLAVVNCLEGLLITSVQLLSRALARNTSFLKRPTLPECRDMQNCPYMYRTVAKWVNSNLYSSSKIIAFSQNIGEQMKANHSGRTNPVCRSCSAEGCLSSSSK